MTNKKLLFVVFALIGMVSAKALIASDRGSRYDGIRFIEAPVSSGVVSGLSPKPCRLLRVWVSSQPTSSLTDYFIIFDTNALSNVTDINSFAPANYKSPPTNFALSTITVGGFIASPYKALDYGEDGVQLSTPPYVYKSGATSGLSRRVFLEIDQ